VPTRLLERRLHLPHRMTNQRRTSWPGSAARRSVQSGACVAEATRGDGSAPSAGHGEQARAAPKRRRGRHLLHRTLPLAPDDSGGTACVAPGPSRARPSPPSGAP
jgi:hypothetical protein